MRFVVFAMLLWGCAGRGDFNVTHSCTCVRPDGGAEPIMGVRQFCDVTGDQAVTMCEQLPMMDRAFHWAMTSDGSCVNITACSCTNTPYTGDDD